jgi:hypothetical protein
MDLSYTISRISYILCCWIASRAYIKISNRRRTSRAKQSTTDVVASNTTQSLVRENSSQPEDDAPYLPEDAAAFKKRNRKNHLKKANKACDKCRESKTKCITDPTLSGEPRPPCQRCKTAKRECVFGPERFYTASRPRRGEDTASVSSSSSDYVPHELRKRKRAPDNSHQEPIKRVSSSRERRASFASTSSRVDCDTLLEPEDVIVLAGSTPVASPPKQKACISKMRVQSPTPDIQVDQSELQVPNLERTQFLRRKIFGKLLQILRSKNPSMEVDDGFDLMINEVWTPDIKAHMLEGGRLPEIKQAFFHWTEMHTQLFTLRKTTGYQGSGGKAWIEYVNNLTDWDSKCLALEAFNVMDMWKWDMRAKNEWIDEPSFGRDLAMFFVRLVDLPECHFDFMMRGFSLYNKELLLWFP